MEITSLNSKILLAVATDKAASEAQTVADSACCPFAGGEVYSNWHKLEQEAKAIRYNANWRAEAAANALLAEAAANEASAREAAKPRRRR